MKLLLIKMLAFAGLLYLAVCVLLYFFQERIIFFPSRLQQDYRFSFAPPFKEIFFDSRDGTQLHGLLFTTDSSKGLVFYLHGNAGALDRWGEVAATYTRLHYDVFIPDYRGYGKSNGRIESDTQLLHDMEAAYNLMQTKYSEDSMVILGYSLGSGPAAWLAAHHQPKLLVLQAPYYSTTDLMRRMYPLVPTFLLRYRFNTFDYLRQCKAPVLIFHGEEDEVIYPQSSAKLKAALKPGDAVIFLPNQGHNGIASHPQYLPALHKALQ